MIFNCFRLHAFPDKQTCHPCGENAADSILCTLANNECQFLNWKCVLQKCTACTYIPLPGVERDSSNQAPMNMFDTHMTQFSC